MTHVKNGLQLRSVSSSFYYLSNLYLITVWLKSGNLSSMNHSSLSCRQLQWLVYACVMDLYKLWYVTPLLPQGAILFTAQSEQTTTFVFTSSFHHGGCNRPKKFHVLSSRQKTTLWGTTGIHIQAQRSLWSLSLKIYGGLQKWSWRGGLMKLVSDITQRRGCAVDSQGQCRCWKMEISFRRNRCKHHTPPVLK